MTLLNLFYYRAPSRGAPAGTRVSVLIPARDEVHNIDDAILSVRANIDVEFEIVIGDDHSTDGTAGVVERHMREDSRVRLVQVPALPGGWSGKQHACHVLARHARHSVLLFMDADVRLRPNAVSRMAGALLSRGLGLASGFPRQIVATFGERLIIPLIHVLLLGYLPMFLARYCRAPGFAAGCGQLMIVNRDAYRAAGGHAAIRASLHDGLKLPRAVRRAGYMTDLFDATDLASCRMYRGWREVWRGFSKNATEGMATPIALPIWTVLLLGGHVVPWFVVAAALVLEFADRTLFAAMIAMFANLVMRAILAVRFRQPVAGAVLHPLSVAAMLALQWCALVRRAHGKAESWRGRIYPSGGAATR